MKSFILFGLWLASVVFAFLSLQDSYAGNLNAAMIELGLSIIALITMFGLAALTELTVKQTRI